VPENTRLIATKADDGFSDDEADESSKTDAQNAYGPSAFAYVSDEEEDLDSDASVDGPVKANDPWGCARRCDDFTVFTGFFLVFLTEQKMRETSIGFHRIL
jgi:hypothetical protein